MRQYMDYLEELFLSYVGWNIEDSYANVILSSKSILDFDVPRGASLHVSSQTSDNSFTDYTLSNFGALNGSVAYLYSSCPKLAEPSWKIPLQKLVQCYRQYPLTVPTSRNQPRSGNGSFLYGRMYLPGQQLEAIYMQSLGRSAQLVAKWVVDQRLASPLVLTVNLHSASKNWTREFLYSTQENLIGFRCLTNLGNWTDPEGQSRLDTGMEMFYAANKKSPGISAGVRYFTHSRYSAVPLTLTLVSNPLMGSVSAAYSLKPTPLSALSTRFDFNLYSYMSDLTIGCELWRNTPISLQSEYYTEKEQKKKTPSNRREGPVSVIKASTSLASQSAQIMWEGSLRDFLVSTGVRFCYGDRAAPVMFGMEFVYSS